VTARQTHRARLRALVAAHFAMPRVDVRALRRAARLAVIRERVRARRH